MSMRAPARNAQQQLQPRTLEEILKVKAPGSLPLIVTPPPSTGGCGCVPKKKGCTGKGKSAEEDDDSSDDE